MNRTEEPESAQDESGIEEAIDPRVQQAWDECYRTVLSMPRPNNGKNKFARHFQLCLKKLQDKRCF